MAICLLNLFAIGCTNNSISEVQDLETISLYSQTDQLAQTMEYIRSVEQYEENKFRDKVNSGLNRWANDVAKDRKVEWKASKLLSTLPEKLDAKVLLESLDNKTFSQNDADYIQQSYWCREVARRVIVDNHVLNQEYLFRVALGKVDEDTLEAWEDSGNLLLEAIKVNHPSLVSEEGGVVDASRAEKLTQAVKLFDWAVRNVHMTDALPWPDKKIFEERSLELDGDPEAWPANTGTPGPGYLHYPWQIFRYGTGDYLDRAKIFCLLCQQVDIPAAVLAVDSDQEGHPYQEWLCAAAIGGELFLFDTRIGLPIPGEAEGTIATLSEVKANDKLLSNLSLTLEESTEKTEYPISGEQLSNIRALIYATPESLSSRMKWVESNLVGENRMRLSLDADEYAKAFSGIDSIQAVELWHIPFSTAIYRNQVYKAFGVAAYDQEVGSRLRWLVYDREFYIDRFIAFRTARSAYLRGIFESDKERGVRSAVSYFYSFMYTDQEINELQQNEDVQLRIGILKEKGQSFSDWSKQLQFYQANMRKIRADASFFMAMAQFENGIPQTSLNWLERVSQYDDDGRWAPYYHYHAARAYEANGDYRSAIRKYEGDKSAQRHGSFLRARLVKILAKEDGEKDSEEADAS